MLIKGNFGFLLNDMGVIFEVFKFILYFFRLGLKEKLLFFVLFIKMFILKKFVNDVLG